ncbi:MAG: pilus assembly protein [Oligoflexia bacterium]|nr:pilus assembly protein [Oligoflexia bacterium]
MSSFGVLTVPTLARRRQNSAAGGVIVEFLLALPIVILFFSGILELGRLYSQMTWMSNMAYETALSGAGWPQGGTATAEMDYRTNLLGGMTTYHKMTAIPTRTDSYNAAGMPPNTLLVEMSGHIAPLMQMINGDFRTAMVAPMLSNTGNIAGDLNQFANPACLYDCSGVLITPCCASSACAPSTC